MAAHDIDEADFGIFRPGYAAQAARGFRPRPDNQPLCIAPPLDWDMDPFHDRNWRFQLHAWRMLDPIWREFHGKDWDRLRSEVLPWIRDWYAYHEQGREAELSWVDMAAGLRSEHLALLAHLHGRGQMPLAPDDLRIVHRLSRDHVARLREPAYIAMNNHGLFQLKGLRLLGTVWEGEEFCAGELEYTTRMMDRLLDSQFDERGVHRENSPYYHGFVLKQLELLRPELFPGNAGRLREALARPREVLPWFTFPDGSVAAIGDSVGAGAPLPPTARPDRVVETRSGGPLWIRDLSASGYVVVRSAPQVDAARATMLIVKGQTASDGGHAHADQLSLLLYRAGRHLLADSGKYSYDGGPWRRYFVGDRAHNVAGIAGQGFRPQDTTSRGSCLERVTVAGGCVVVEGEVVRREFFRHRRRVAFRAERCIEIEDLVRARSEDAPVVYWHLGAGIDAERIDGGVELFDNGLRLARISVADPQTTARLLCGREPPRIQGWISPSYRRKVPAVVAEFKAPPGCERISTRIELFAPAPQAPGTLPRPICRGVRLKFPFEFRTDRVTVLADGRTMREVTVDVPAASGEAAAAKLASAMRSSGFSIVERTAEAGALDIAFAHKDRTRAGLRMTTRDGRATLRLSWQRLPRSQAASR